MRLTGQQAIPAPQERVWAGLNDPEVLKLCIPGCESIRKTTDTAFEAKVTVKVGPVKARFTGEVSLVNLDPPESYTITGHGQGGIAGFAKGKADVRLDKVDAEETLLHYDVDAQIGGRLAMLGSRLVDGTARSLAQKFFDKFVELMSRPAPAIPPVKVARAPAKKAVKKKPAKKKARR
jgi:carbon monoxide dehydrogenase subunit G